MPGGRKPATRDDSEPKEIDSDARTETHQPPPPPPPDRQGLAGDVEGWVGERLGLTVEREQPRHVDDRVVHLAPLGLPGDVAAQGGEEEVAAPDECGHHVDPRAVPEVGAPHTAQRVHDDLVVEVEQRPLESGHAPSVGRNRTDVHWWRGRGTARVSAACGVIAG